MCGNALVRTVISCAYIHRASSTIECALLKVFKDHEKCDLDLDPNHCPKYDLDHDQITIFPKIGDLDQIKIMSYSRDYRIIIIALYP